MTSHGGVERIHRVQPERDLVANWEVDLSEKLEEYLLKICSGEITGTEEDSPVNFAEGSSSIPTNLILLGQRKIEFLMCLLWWVCCSCFAASGLGSGVQQESGVLVQLGLTYFGVSIQP